MLAVMFSGVLASKILWRFGVSSMAVRYPMAVVCSYGVFFALVSIWLLYIQASHEGDHDTAVDIGDAVGEGARAVVQLSGSPTEGLGSAKLKDGWGGRKRRQLVEPRRRRRRRADRPGPTRRVAHRRVSAAACTSSGRLRIFLPKRRSRRSWRPRCGDERVWLTSRAGPELACRPPGGLCHRARGSRLVWRIAAAHYCPTTTRLPEGSAHSAYRARHPCRVNHVSWQMLLGLCVRGSASTPATPRSTADSPVDGPVSTHA